MRRCAPGVKGTCTACPAFPAACSTPAHPARTIRSARETRFPPLCAPLNSACTCSRMRSASPSWAGLLASQSFWGDRRMRAPFAPPRLSVPRNDDADAQAVETICETDRPDARTLALRSATSCSPMSSWSTPGTGSCQSCGSAGVRGPRYRLRGPMSRWSSLNHALAKASSNAAGSSRKRLEISAYAGSTRSDRSVVSIMGACRFAGSCASGTVATADAFLGANCDFPAGLFVSSHS